MLGNLLRKGSSHHGGFSLIDDNFSSPMHSNSTITSFTPESNGVSKRSVSPCYDDHFGSLLPCPTSAPPMLDHVSDDLKYKLFGSKNIPYSASFQSQVFSPYVFRVLIAEETGHMTHRDNYNVVFDYSTAESPRMDQIRPNELKEYIFGSPVRSTDASQGSKFRTIPNSDSVMITRIFFFSSVNKNRLAVSLCVPNILLQVISEVWDDVSSWFDQCQAYILATIRGIRHSVSSPYSGYLPPDFESAYPKECDNIVNLLQTRLIPCLRSTSEIPRLFLCPESCPSFVETWFRDIFNWIEIKDGPRLNFLPALLAKIICDFQDPTTARDNTRIVIMSGNMVVANKLIFIVSGLLRPRIEGQIEIESKMKPLSDQPEQSRKENPRRDVNVLEKSNTDLSKYLCAGKAWEIPRENSLSSKVSLSSDESLAYVIQPSSLKSASNSIQCLSSSLSSQHGLSYGSWFTKRSNGSQATLNSPSNKTSEQWEKISNTNGASSLHKTNSNTSLHQFFARGSGATPQPSPSISELDEYPWFSGSDSPRPEPGQNLHPIAKRCLSGAPLGELNIPRDCQRLCQNDLIEKAFNAICKPNEKNALSEGECEIIPGDSRHAAFAQIDVDYNTCHQQRPMELLPKYTTYLANFNYWFQLQAFPVGPDSESKVVHAMRKGLQLGRNTKTLLVSLRSRAIKEISIMRNEETLTTGSHHAIIQKTKKIFNNGKCGNVSTRMANCIAFVNMSIKKAMNLYEDTTVSISQREEELFKIYQSLLNYQRTSRR
ncbi:hypothetical protein HG537_0A02040 [Torulaspora globosa]|uniref:Protein LST4 n=1 Tax=Torulaspora globosa TaxID=48254 RepID=A0A7H9HMH8_9SACH|nr:hypothetical protein HG537_0A02040 [Torulaspora sp. CBS 2947]